MAGPNPLDLKGFLEQSTARSTIEDLQKKGVKKVRVLDQRTLERLIQDAVQRVLAGRSGILSEEEKQRIYAESRRELDRLVREFNSMKKQHESASSDRETLLRELENLQKQLQVQRNVYEEKLRTAKESGGADPAQLQQMADKLREVQTQLTYSKEQNQFLEARGKELEGKVASASGATPEQIQDAFDRGVASQANYISELKSQLEEAKTAQTQATVTEGALAEKMAGLDTQIVDRVSKLFNKTLEGLNRKIATIKHGASGADEVEYRASEQVLENLLKEEIQSNLGNISSEQKVASKGMDDKLAKLKGLQQSFKPKKDKDKKE